MNIRQAHQKDIPQMKELWKICFGDDDSYIDFYYNKGFKCVNTLVATQDNQLLSMLTMLPTLFYTNKNIYKGIYFYAVCTSPEARGKGLMRKMEQVGCNMAQKKGAKFACLVPQTPDLFQMYEKLAYETTFHLAHLNFPAMDYEKYSSTTNISTINGEYYNKLRQLYISSLVFAVQFDGYVHSYAYDELIKAGAIVLSVQNKFGHGYLTYYIHDDTLIIKEIGMSLDCFNASIFDVCKKLSVEQVQLRANTNLFDEAPTKPYGMFKSLDKSIDFPMLEKPYMNMMLD